MHGVAVSHFEAGTRLETDGDCNGAMAEYQASLAIEPGVGARLNLADCEERLGLLEAAWKDYRLATHIAVDRSDDRVKLAHAGAERLEKKLELIIVPHVAGLRLVVDGETVDTVLSDEGWIAVKPGAHRIEATAPGREPLLMTTPVEDSPARSIALPPLAERPEERPAPSPASTPLGGSTQRAIGVALGALGLIGIATGSIAGIRTIDERNQAAGACGGGYPQCSLATQRAVSSANAAAETSATIATTAFVAGGVGLAAGTLLYLTAPRAKVRIGPTVGAGSVGATVGGGF